MRLRSTEQLLGGTGWFANLRGYDAWLGLLLLWVEVNHFKRKNLLSCVDIHQRANEMNA